MADASSVTGTPSPSAAPSASRSIPRRNICGVKACQITLRSTVSATRPSASARLSVSRAGTASSPPTGSAASSCKSLSKSSRARLGRAASCTSTQSWSAAPIRPRRCRPLSTESHRSRPPGARWMRGSLAQGRPGQYGSSAATQTTNPASVGWSRKQSRVCSMMQRPATCRYCLGRSARIRLPTPAAGITTQNAGWLIR